MHNKMLVLAPWVSAVLLMFPSFAQAGSTASTLFVKTPLVVGDTSVGLAGLNSYGVTAGDQAVTITEVTDAAYLRPAGTTKVFRLQMAAGTTTTTVKFEWAISQIPVDMDALGVMYYVASASSNPNFTFNVNLAETSAYANYYTYFMSGTYPNTVATLGWNYAVVSLASPNATIGSPDLAHTFQRVRILVNTVASNAIDVYICPVLLKVKLKPTVVFTFDDNSASQYTEAFSYMQARGMVGSVAVQTSVLSGISVAHQQDMQAAGWSMHNHTQTHMDLGAATTADAITELNGAEATLITNGLRSGRKIVVYPFGSTSDALEAAMQTAGYVAGASINNYQPEFPLYGFAKPMRISRRSTDVTSGLTLGQLTAKVDTLLQTGGVLVFYTHQILVGASTIDTERDTFRGLVDYVHALNGRIQVLNLSELYWQVSNTSRFASIPRTPATTRSARQ